MATRTGAALATWLAAATVAAMTAVAFAQQDQQPVAQPTYVYFQPVTTEETVASGAAEAGRYLMPPGQTAVRATVTAFGTVLPGAAAGSDQFFYVRLLVENAGDRPLTLDPTGARLTDDMGHRVVGGQLFSGQTPLATATLNPGARDELYLGFALPPESRFAAIGAITVEWLYRYGDQPFAASARFVRVQGPTEPAQGTYWLDGTAGAAGSPLDEILPDTGYVPEAYGAVGEGLVAAAEDGTSAAYATSTYPSAGYVEYAGLPTAVCAMPQYVYLPVYAAPPVVHEVTIFHFSVYVSVHRDPHHWRWPVWRPRDPWSHTWLGLRGDWRHGQGAWYASLRRSWPHDRDDRRDEPRDRRDGPPPRFGDRSDGDGRDGFADRRFDTRDPRFKPEPVKVKTLQSPEEFKRAAAQQPPTVQTAGPRKGDQTDIQSLLTERLRAQKDDVARWAGEKQKAPSLAATLPRDDQTEADRQRTAEEGRRLLAERLKVQRLEAARREADATKVDPVALQQRETARPREAGDVARIPADRTKLQGEADARRAEDARKAAELAARAQEAARREAERQIAERLRAQQEEAARRAEDARKAAERAAREQQREVERQEELRRKNQRVVVEPAAPPVTVFSAPVVRPAPADTPAGARKPVLAAPAGRPVTAKAIPLPQEKEKGKDRKDEK